MNPWSILGLAADADTRSIKRRYAQLLKTHRPDDNAEAFQCLRQAYEQALACAEGNVHEPVATIWAPARTSQPALSSFGHDVPDNASPAFNVRLQPSRAESSDFDRAQRLLEQAASLDEALTVARDQWLEPALQLQLLQRCLKPDEQRHDSLRWAMARLNWLTPWQADYLPLASMNILAERLFDAELCNWRLQLEAGQECAVLDEVQQLLAEEWLQPFDRRGYAQQGLLALLEEGEGWSLTFFDGICQLLGWDETRGQMPCDSQRWERLCERCEGLTLRDDLRRLLGEERPEHARARAAWLLLKPLSDAERRKLTDVFDETDWRDCESLARCLEQRDSGLPEHLRLSYLHQWREWRPGNGWSQLYPLLWAGISLVLLMLILLSKGQAIEGPADLAITVGVALVIATALLIVLRLVARGWDWFARGRVLFDVEVSQRLLPASWARRGTGILLLRHIVPSAFFAVLTLSWAQGQALAPVLALLVFALCLQCINVASKGGLPAAWLIVAWRLLAPLGKQILIWLLILVLAFVLSRLLIELKRQEREVNVSRPLGVLNPCVRSGYAQQQDCESAMQMVREAMQRSARQRAERQNP